MAGGANGTAQKKEGDAAFRAMVTKREAEASAALEGAGAAAAAGTEAALDAKRKGGANGGAAQARPRLESAWFFKKFKAKMERNLRSCNLNNLVSELAPLHNGLETSTFTVCARVRPVSAAESKAGGFSCVLPTPGKAVQVEHIRLTPR